MPVVPLLKTPLSDLTSVISTHQIHGNCREIEMKLVNCLEAYGNHRGVKNCSVLLNDFQECFTKEKQMNRIYEMRKERKRQYKAGEKSIDELYIPPPREDAVH